MLPGCASWNGGAFSPDNRMLAVGFSDHKAALKLWRLPTK